MATNQVQKVGWWHERLADWMLTNPDRTLKDAAQEFKVTPACIYLIHNSDAFKIYWATRTDDYSRALEGKTIEKQHLLQEKAAAAAEMALDELADQIANKGATLPVGTLLDIAKMGLGALNLTANKNNVPQVNVNINAVDPEALARARKRVEELHAVRVEEARAREAIVDPKMIELQATEA